MGEGPERGRVKIGGYSWPSSPSWAPSAYAGSLLMFLFVSLVPVYSRHGLCTSFQFTTKAFSWPGPCGGHVLVQSSRTTAGGPALHKGHRWGFNWVYFPQHLNIIYIVATVNYFEMHVIIEQGRLPEGRLQTGFEPRTFHLGVWHSYQLNSRRHLQPLSRSVCLCDCLRHLGHRLHLCWAPDVRAHLPLSAGGHQDQQPVPPRPAGPHLQRHGLPCR